MGNLVLNIIVQLESSAPFGGDDRGITLAGGDPNEGGDQTDPLGRRIVRKVDNRGRGLGGNDSRERNAFGHDGDEDETWNFSKIRDRRRTVVPVSQPEQRRGSYSGEVTMAATLHLNNDPEIGARAPRHAAGDISGTPEAKVQWLQKPKCSRKETEGSNNSNRSSRLQALRFHGKRKKYAALRGGKVEVDITNILYGFSTGTFECLRGRQTTPPYEGSDRIVCPKDGHVIFEQGASCPKEAFLLKRV